jgi:gliding motility-associated-like protein
VSRLLLLIFILFVFGFNASGQYTSDGGRFRVDEVRGCAPFAITIQATDLISGVTCNPCNMDFLGNNNAQQNQLTFTYTIPGNYRLSVNYPNASADFIDVTVYQNIQPSYELYTCSGSQVSIKVTEQIYDQYFIDFGDGSPQLSIPKSTNQVAQHPYGAAGNYTILVNGKKNQAANNCAAKPTSFVAVATLPTPQISALTSLDETSTKLDFTRPVNVQYKLEMATNGVGFAQLLSLYDVATVTTNNLRLDNSFYCFRLSAYDPCSFQNNYSPVICNQKLTTTSQNNQNKLDWQTHTVANQITSVDINRDQAFYRKIIGAPVTAIDPDVICETNYCYQVVSNYAWGGKSSSLVKCAFAISTNVPSTILNSSAVVSDAGVQLTWLQPPLSTAVEYSILKATGTGSFIFYDKAILTDYVDGAFSVAEDQCYKVNYIDKCDNVSANSMPICPIQLVGSLNDENEVSLSWNAFTGWNQGVKNYILEKYDQSGNLLSATNQGLNLSYSESQVDIQNQITSYRIIANPKEIVLAPSMSNKVKLTKLVNLFFPTAFTPDRKGPTANELFKVRGQFITKLEISIFDRWGTLVFYSDKNEAWDGFQNGQPMPVSTYVWTANITDLSGKSYKKSGTVVLMRK